MTSHTDTPAVLSHRKQQGFTLIEIMVVVAILGILTAIAIPNYTQYVQNSRRGDAAAVLMANQQFMQRFYAANNRYDALIDGKGGPPTLPTTRSPDNGTIAYNISFLGTPTRTTYSLQAIPTASMNGDKCGTLTINETGARGLVNNEAGTTVAQCWK